jgi:subtilisin family serine protease
MGIRMLVLRVLCATVTVLATVVAAPLSLGQKIHPRVLERAQSEPLIPVFIVLTHQPQREIVQQAEGANALHRQASEARYRQAAEAMFPRADELRQARDAVDTVVLRTRQQALRATEQAIRPEQDELESRLKALGATSIFHYLGINMLAAEIPGTAIGALEADPVIAQVFPVEKQFAQLATSVPALGAPAFWNAGYTGQGESVGILDTGIRNDHPAFAGLSIISQVFLANGRTDSCFADNVNSAQDLQGHGTHVAGIVASQGSAGWTNYIGVARGIGTLYNLKIGYLLSIASDCPSVGAESDPRDVLAALDWAVANTPLKIFNYSYGTPFSSDQEGFTDSIDRYIDTYGLTITIAAGNGGQSGYGVTIPGDACNGITVGNWVSRGLMNPTSSWGPATNTRKKPDLAAPGTDIFSAAYNWDVSSGTSGYFVSHTGTSMAAPHIAGAAALLGSAGISNPLAVKAILINTADGSGDWAEHEGWGYTNLTTALAETNHVTGSVPAGEVRLYRMSPAAATRATLTWNRHITAGVPQLNHLILSLYAADTGALLSTQAAGLNQDQNVDVVSAAGATAAVLAVNEIDTSLQGVDSEPYALASSGPLTAISGYHLSGTCALPSSVPAGSRFSVTCGVTNSGDLSAPGVGVLLALPLGFSGDLQAPAATIAAASTSQFVLNLTAPTTAGVYSIDWNLTAPSSFGLAAYSAQQSTVISVAPSLLPPVLIAPASGALAVSLTPTFTWTAPPSATAFDIYLGTTWPLPLVGTTAKTSYTPAVLAPDARYFWQVVARGDAGASSSVLWSFVTTGPDGQAGLIIVTAAGNGVLGPSMSGVPATSSPLYNPWGVAVDATRNLYIAQSGGAVSEVSAADGIIRTIANASEQRCVAADAAGNLYVSGQFRVYRIAPDGTSTIVAGNGDFSYTGDGGPATSAGLSGATGLTLDAQGNLYISDYSNWVVRKVSTKGIITTVAGDGKQDNGHFGWGDGGPATSAEINGPTALAVDSTGALYVYEDHSFRIRKVTPDGIINTFARVGSAGGLAVDAADNLYASDNSNNTVLKFSPHGSSTQIAGNGLPFESGDGGAPLAASLHAGPIAIDNAGTFYISGGWGRVRAIVPADPACRYSLDQTTVAVPATDSTFLISVQTGPGCYWSAEGGNWWLSASIAGKGPGVASPSVSYNDGPARSLMLTVAGVPVTVIQAAASCSYAVDPGVASIPASGGPGSLTVTTNPNCPWSVSSPPGWLTFSGPTLGVGSGTINYTAARNSGGIRSATLNITGQTVGLQQAGIGGFGLRFVPVAPCRLADTRYTSAIAGNNSRDFVPPQLGCGIPATAQAYSLNVTAVPPGYLGYLTMWPTGEPQPLVSTLNSWRGLVVSNAAIVPAGPTGSVSVFVSDDSHVILDINGYFDTSSSQPWYSFYPVAPCRLVDTRFGTGQFGGPSMDSMTPRDFPIPLGNCGAPTSASAYSLNFTVVPSGYLGFLTTWPTGQTQPNVSTLNSWTGRVVANAAIVPAGTNESVSVYVSNSTDVILDINGYFGLAGGWGGLSFYSVTPCRVADTRNADGPLGGPIMAPATARSFPVPSSACGIPTTAAAYSMNVTVVPDGGLGYLTVWPTGSAQPFVSTLNSFDGSVVANAAIVPAGTSGAISVFTAGSTHVVLDINGYFAP